MNSPRSYILCFLAAAVILASVQVSLPLARYLLFHEEYVFRCQVVLHHGDHHHGQCQLKLELSSAQGHQKNADLTQSKGVHSPDPWLEQKSGNGWIPDSHSKYPILYLAASYNLPILSFTPPPEV